MSAFTNLLARMILRQQEFNQTNAALDKAAKDGAVRQFIHSRSSKGVADVERGATAAADDVVSKVDSG